MGRITDEGFENYCDKSGAEELAGKIRAYWADRGYTVNVKLEHHGFAAAMRAARYDVRSNMKNGLPVDLLVDEARKAA